MSENFRRFKRRAHSAAIIKSVLAAIGAATLTNLIKGVMLSLVSLPLIKVLVERLNANISDTVRYGLNLIYSMAEQALILLKELFDELNEYVGYRLYIPTNPIIRETGEDFFSIISEFSACAPTLNLLHFFCIMAIWIC